LERLTLGLGHLGAAASGRRQARDDFRFPLNYLGIRAGFPRRQNLLDDLDGPLDLLIRHFLDRIAMLDLVLTGHQQSENLEVARRLLPRDLLNCLLALKWAAEANRYAAACIDLASRFGRDGT